MRTIAIALFAIVQFAVVGAGADAQAQTRRLVAKNGESVELGSIYWVVNCRSVMIGLPDVEVIEGPPGVTLTIKEEPVLPRRQGCAAKVAGGTLMLNAKDVTEPSEAKLTYRVNYKTKDGPRQTSNAYIVSLFP